MNIKLFLSVLKHGYIFMLLILVTVFLIILPIWIFGIEMSVQLIISYIIIFPIIIALMACHYDYIKIFE